MVKLQPSKLVTWVRFPLPALLPEPKIRPAMKKLLFSLRNQTIHLASSLALLSMGQTFAGPSTCDDIAVDVRTAIAKDPGKTLMVVEDALVINETCACEIVKTAIDAAHADEGLIQQIVQTAIAVAPKMSAVITECAGVSAPAAAPVTAAATGSEKSGGKAGISVQPVAPVVPPQESGETFSYVGPRYIRGVYLVQPAAVGFGGLTESEDDEKPSTGGSHGRSGSKIVRRTTHVPTSPSCTCP